MHDFPNRTGTPRRQGRHPTAHVTCRYDKFEFDITDALEKGKNSTHELAVRVFDPTGLLFAMLHPTQVTHHREQGLTIRPTP